MWDWEEGLGEAISTFYQAEQFLREYDYIFNHNEALLYEFVEEKDPELFAAIRGSLCPADIPRQKLFSGEIRDPSHHGHQF